MIYNNGIELKLLPQYLRKDSRWQQICKKWDRVKAQDNGDFISLHCLQQDCLLSDAALIYVYGRVEPHTRCPCSVSKLTNLVSRNGFLGNLKHFTREELPIMCNFSFCPNVCCSGVRKSP